MLQLKTSLFLSRLKVQRAYVWYWGGSFRVTSCRGTKDHSSSDQSQDNNLHHVVANQKELSLFPHVLAFYTQYPCRRW